MMNHRSLIQAKHHAKHHCVVEPPYSVLVPLRSSYNKIDTPHSIYLTVPQYFQDVSVNIDLPKLVTFTYAVDADFHVIRH